MEPTYYPKESIVVCMFDLGRAAGLWFYGNLRLLDTRRAFSEKIFTADCPCGRDDVEKETEELVLSGKTIICGVHNEAHQRAAIVPLRWGAPRIIVIGGGFKGHLGPDLKDELFRAARLWRYQFDPQTDLVVSTRPPESRIDLHRFNPRVDRLIRALSNEQKHPLIG